MPAKRRAPKKMKGGDFLGIGNFFKNKVWPAIKTGANYVKDKGLISKGLDHLGQGTAAKVARMVGVGKKKKRAAPKKKKMAGGAKMKMLF